MQPVTARSCGALLAGLLFAAAPGIAPAADFTMKIGFVTINEVAANGDTPVAINFQQAFNAPSSPWLTLVRDAVLGDGTSVDADNDEITAVLSQ